MLRNLSSCSVNKFLIILIRYLINVEKEGRDFLFVCRGFVGFSIAPAHREFSALDVDHTLRRGRCGRPWWPGGLLPGRQDEIKNYPDECDGYRCHDGYQPCSQLWFRHRRFSLDCARWRILNSGSFLS